MLIIFSFVTVGLFIGWIEYKQLKESKEIKLNILFSLLLAIGMLLNILNVFLVKPPSLLGWLIIVYEPVYHLLNS